MGCAVSSLTVRPIVTVEPDAAKEVVRSSSFKTGVVTPLIATGLESKRIKSGKIEEEVNALLDSGTFKEENVVQDSIPKPDLPHLTNEDVDSHQADESGFLYRDVTNIVNPKNIIAAVKRGDLQTVKELCECKIGSQESCVNTVGMWNSSPLMIATQYAQDEIANFLLNQDDIKIDHVNDNGVSTLLIACSGGNFDIVSRLLDMGANANPATATAFFNQQIDKSMSATPLSVAIMNGHYKCVDALLRYSNIVNKTLDFPVLVSPKTSSNRMTPIMLACLYGQHSVVSVLLAYNANCILTDSSNSNLLHYTARAGVKAAGVFEVLRAGLEEQVLRSLVLYTDVRGYTALHHACLNNQLDIIPILISLGSDVNMRTAPLSDSICHVEGREESRSSSVRSSAGSILPPIPIQTSTDDISIGGDSAAKATEKRQTSETVSNRSINNSTGSGNMIRSISMSLFSSSSKDGKTDGKIEGVMKGLECSSSPADFPAEGVCVSQRSIVGSSPLPDADTVRHLSDGNSNDNINSGIVNSCSIGITPNDKKSTRSMKATAPSSSVVWGVTPLHIAVKKRSEVAVTLLLGENANPVIKDDSDVSPLDLAKKLRADSPILLILNKAASMLSEKSCSRSDVCLVPDDIEGTSFKSQPRGL